ncbi:MAG: FkbM family methyltransferase [Chloroflexi bacterium]|nr:FkbM family methyltransferase [Chloroflexota bacterium]
MRRLEQELRRQLSPLGRYQLSRIRKVALQDLSTITRQITGLLPLRVAASLKEGIARTGNLDYQATRILMDVSTLTQVERLNACQKEPETVTWIETHIRTGDVFYDVGANVGAYSFVADAVTGGLARIFAFEPGSTTYAALAQNIFLNDCHQRIVPLPLALSDYTGLRMFHYSSIVPGAASHVMPDVNMRLTSETQMRSQYVLSCRIDDLVSQFGMPVPNLMKIDVDGSEMAVIQGAIQVFRGSILRSLLVEVDEQAPQTRELVQMLEGFGFDLASRHHHVGSNCVANYIFVRRNT